MTLILRCPSCSNSLRLPDSAAGKTVRCPDCKTPIHTLGTFVYKRTHNDDPGDGGCFGIFCCMGKMRSWPFEAVIGVGATGKEAETEGIAGKVNWIGIGRKPIGMARDGHPIWAFKQFKQFSKEEAPDFRHVAPILAKRLYDARYPPRFVMDKINDDERREISKVLRMARDADPSPRISSRERQSKNCRRRKSTRC
jgi:hypothetical protein